MSHIFISYSRADQIYARKLADKLLAEGFNVWIDDRIDYGDDWWHEIVKAIRECDAFIVIMTPSSDQSRWVQREVTIADQLGKPAFPLFLAGTSLSESQNWLMYIRTQYADVRRGELPKTDFYQRLAETTTRNRRTGGIDVAARRVRHHRLRHARPRRHNESPCHLWAGWVGPRWR